MVDREGHGGGVDDRAEHGGGGEGGGVVDREEHGEGGVVYRAEHRRGGDDGSPDGLVMGQVV